MGGVSWQVVIISPDSAEVNVKRQWNNLTVPFMQSAVTTVGEATFFGGLFLLGFTLVRFPLPLQFLSNPLNVNNVNQYSISHSQVDRRGGGQRKEIGCQQNKVSAIGKCLSDQCSNCLFNNFRGINNVHMTARRARRWWRSTLFSRRLLRQDCVPGGRPGQGRVGSQQPPPQPPTIWRHSQGR